MTRISLLGRKPPDRRAAGRLVVLLAEATLRRLDKAFAVFFRRIRNGETAGYAPLKGVGHFDTVTFPKDGDGCRWDSTSDDWHQPSV